RIKRQRNWLIGIWIGDIGDRVCGSVNHYDPAWIARLIGKVDLVGDWIHRNGDWKSTAVDRCDRIRGSIDHSYRTARNVDLVGHRIGRNGGGDTTDGDRCRDGLRLAKQRAMRESDDNH